MNTTALDNLIEKILLLKDERQVKSFLKTVLTPKELSEISVRLQIIAMLKDGIPQREIADKLKVSIGTITRGSREFQYGDQKIIKLIA